MAVRAVRGAVQRDPDETGHRDERVAARREDVAR
ncbi:hypothetical protein HGI09_52240 [Streptomyces collinus]|nr:hypothetical protein HGI09_52240 [Streptomyces collinus]